MDSTRPPWWSWSSSLFSSYSSSNRPFTLITVIIVIILYNLLSEMNCKCPDDNWSTYPNRTDCYFISNYTATWQEASDNCQTFNNATLMTVRDEEELDLLKQIRNSTNKELWVIETFLNFILLLLLNYSISNSSIDWFTNISCC
jgi:hypothetical protein